MKDRRYQGWMMILATVGLLAAATLPMSAGQQYSGTLPGATSLTTISNATVTTTSSTAWPVPQNVDVNFEVNVVGTDAGTNQVIIGCNYTIDNGLTWTTTTPLMMTNRCFGTTNVIDHRTIPKASLTGITHIRWDYCSTAQTNATVSIKFGYFY